MSVEDLSEPSMAPKSDTWAAPRLPPGPPAVGQWAGEILDEAEENDFLDVIDIGEVDLSAVLPGPQGGSQQQQLDARLDSKFLTLQPHALLRFFKECTPLAIATVFLSLLSFGFASFYFFLVLQVPVPSDRALPVGFDSWTSCHVNATRPAVTAIGHELPFNRARALISVPKYISVGLLCTLAGGLLSKWQPVLSWIIGSGQFLLILLTVPIYIFADGLGMRGVPTIVDPAATTLMLLMVIVPVSLLSIRPRRATTSAVARFPKFAFCVATMILFCTSSVLVNVLGVLAKSGVNPGLVVGIATVFVRACSFVARGIFRSLKLPVAACFVILFTYEVGTVLSVRRYWLALPTMSDVAMAAVVSAVVEIACNSASAIYAVWSYRAFVRKGLVDLAHVQIGISFVSIMCDLVAEHVALHGSLGYNLFLDPRILTIDMQEDKDQAIRAWGLSFAVEVVVDAIFVTPLLLFLPVSPDKLLRKHLSLPVFLFLPCACVYCHLIGLHAYLLKSHYFCE